MLGPLNAMCYVLRKYLDEQFSKKESKSKDELGKYVFDNKDLQKILD